MNKKTVGTGMRVVKTSLLIMSTVVFSIGCHKSNVDQKDLRNFEVVNLVANNSEYHPRTIDRTLQNGFGIAWSPTGIAWVNSVLGHVSDLYSAEGDIVRPPVNIPSTTDSIGGFPCGIVFSGDKNFKLGSGRAAFIFSSFDGVISAWNGGNNATRILAPNGASYTGLAIGSSGGRNFIYGANFGLKRIDVWDSAFKRVAMPFVDPTLPSDYSPYNIQAVGDFLFVMYAKLATDGPNKGHGVEGLGNGFVSVFNTDGSFVKRFASRGTLDVPWGVTMAPGSFLEDKDMNDSGDGNKNFAGSDSRRGHDSKDPVILVGNFGDGHINVFSEDGRFLGQLQSHRQPLVIEGLWALTFPPSSARIDPRRLYFSAGPDSERDGVFGFIVKQ